MTSGQIVVVPSSVVGSTAGPVELALRSRDTMAFAAGLPDPCPDYYSSDLLDGPAVHPLFVVALEWAALNPPGRGPLSSLPPGVVGRGVHASHELRIHRPLQPGIDSSVTVSVGVRACRESRSGARVLVRFTGADRTGAALWTTDMELAFRGLALDGPGRGEWARVIPPPPEFGLGCEDVQVVIDLAAPHAYSACSGIWNPIHTDTIYARSMGLRGPILHGTHAAALAVSRILELRNVPASKVRQFRVRFGVPVLIPSTSVLRVARPLDEQDPIVRFEMLDDHGEAALRDGLVLFDQ